MPESAFDDALGANSALLAYGCMFIAKGKKGKMKKEERFRREATPDRSAQECGRQRAPRALKLVRKLRSVVADRRARVYQKLLSANALCSRRSLSRAIVLMSNHVLQASRFATICKE